MPRKKYDTKAVWNAYLFLIASVATVLLLDNSLCVIVYGYMGLSAGYYIGICQRKETDGE